MNKTFNEIRLTPTVKLKNRLTVSPMTTQQSNKDGSLSIAEAKWLERLAADGYGMVITCATAISKESIAYHNQLNMACDTHLTDLKALASSMRRHGSVNIIQLCHGGTRSNKELNGGTLFSASHYEMPMIPDFNAPEAMTLENIKKTISDFAEACYKAEKAGWDGIELHGANGYLISQFVSKMSNLRTDEYGGKLEQRALFSRELVRACRSRVSENFVIGYRISFEGAGYETGLDLDENIQLVNWLYEDGINYIHSSQFNYAAISKKYPDKTIIEYVRKKLPAELPLIVSGSIESKEEAENAITLGADIVAIGRAAIGNKELPGYFEQNKPLPYKMPYSVKLLRENCVSDSFLEILQNLPSLKSLNIVEQN